MVPLIRHRAAALSATLAVFLAALIASYVITPAGSHAAVTAAVTGPYHVDVIQCEGVGDFHGDYVQWENAMDDALGFLDKGTRFAGEVGRVRLSKGSELWASWNFQGACGIQQSGTDEPHPECICNKGHTDVIRCASNGGGTVSHFYASADWLSSGTFVSAMHVNNTRDSRELTSFADGGAPNTAYGVSDYTWSWCR